MEQAWHTWCCSPTGVEDDDLQSPAFSEEINGSQERLGEEPHAELPGCFPLFESLSVENTHSFYFSTHLAFSGLPNGWSTSQHALISQQGSAWVSALCTANADRHVWYLMHFRVSTSLDRQVSLLESRTQAKSPASAVVAVKKQHYNSLCRAAMWETLMWGSLFVLIATTTSGKHRLEIINLSPM